MRKIQSRMLGFLHDCEKCRAKGELCPEHLKVIEFFGNKLGPEPGPKVIQLVTLSVTGSATLFALKDDGTIWRQIGEAHGNGSRRLDTAGQPWQDGGHHSLTEPMLSVTIITVPADPLEGQRKRLNAKFDKCVRNYRRFVHSGRFDSPRAFYWLSRARAANRKTDANLRATS